MNLESNGTTPDLTAVKTRQQATWSSGDYAVIGTTLQIVGETLCEAVDVRAESRVLDVACGNGNATLAAARRFARVTGVDYVPALLRKASARAAAEGLAIELVEGDAERLPFDDEAFDDVLSAFGVMFTANQARAASELVRVTKRGGRIGLANWTPTGFVGAMLRTIGRHVPPPAGVPSPTLWGTHEHVAKLFGDSVASLDVRRREFDFRYASASHFIETFRAYYGPMNRAFATLDERGRAALTSDLEALLHEHARGGGASLVVPAEYLEIIAVRR